jgi:hypothetical protein
MNVLPNPYNFNLREAGQRYGTAPLAQPNSGLRCHAFAPKNGPPHLPASGNAWSLVATTGGGGGGAPRAARGIRAVFVRSSCGVWYGVRYSVWSVFRVAYGLTYML